MPPGGRDAWLPVQTYGKRQQALLEVFENALLMTGGFCVQQVMFKGKVGVNHSDKNYRQWNESKPDGLFSHQRAYCCEQNASHKERQEHFDVSCFTPEHGSVFFLYQFCQGNTRLAEMIGTKVVAMGIPIA